MKMKFNQQHKYLVLFMVIALAVSVQSADNYRDFTNQAGKAIHARIVQYDAEGGRVQLELKNRKKAWVEISTLSEADQAYTKQWDQEKSTAVSVPEDASKEGSATEHTWKKLTRKEVLNVGKLYVKAVQDKDYELWCSLFPDLYKGDERLNKKRFVLYTQEQGDFISVAGTDDHNVQISMSFYNGDGTRWLLLQPDGRIKYDFLVFLHPFEDAHEWLAYLKRCDDEGIYVSRSGTSIRADSAYIVKRLEELGVPSFGYDNASEREQKKCRKQMANWLIELDEDWDISEPKLTLPKDRYDAVIQRLKTDYR